MQFNLCTVLAALAMASATSAQVLCREAPDNLQCSGDYPKLCIAISGTGVRFHSCCKPETVCGQP
ncbi:hypothetical protein ACLX1H_004647 [Fusarium chlamydosporum]